MSTATLKSPSTKLPTSSDLDDLILQVLAEFCCCVSTNEIFAAVQEKSGGFFTRSQVHNRIQSLVYSKKIERHATFSLAATSGRRNITTDLIVAAVERNGGSKPAAAAELGVSLKTIYNRLAEKAPTPPALAEIISSRRDEIVRTRKRKVSNEQIAEAIRKTQGNRVAAARLLGISKQLVSQRLHDYPAEFTDIPPAQRGRGAKKRRIQAAKPAPDAPQPAAATIVQPPPPAPPPPPKPAPKPAPRFGLQSGDTAWHLKASQPMPRSQKSTPQAFHPNPRPRQKPPADPTDLPRRPALRPTTPPPAGMAIDLIWGHYKANKSEGFRNALVEHYFRIVEIAAQKLAAKLPDQYEPEDFIAAGIEGLLGAIDGFDLDRGLKFETYAPMRVRGAMLDEIRNLDWVPRLVRANTSRINRAREELHLRLNREATDCEVAEYLGITTAELSELIVNNTAVGTISLDKKFYETDSFKDVREVDVLDDAKAPRPGDRSARLDMLRKMTKGLNKHERIIIIGYYFEEDTMKEIGRQLGLSESRVSQMHSALIERMRKQYDGAEVA